MTETRLAGRRILITGAASGIGRATAQRFAAAGARLALLDRDATGLEAVAKEAGGAAAIPCDLADTTAIAPAVDRAALDLGGLDGLICAAGIDLVKPIEAMTPEEWALMRSHTVEVARIILQSD